MYKKADAIKPVSGSTGAREKLLATTIQLLESSCLHNISLRTISKKAGTNIALVSYYFGSKELLYKAVLQEQCTSFEAVIDSIFSADGDIAENFTNAFSTLASFHATNPHWLKLYLREIANPTQWYEQIIQPCMSKATNKAIAMLKSGVAQGVFRQDIQPVHVVQALFGMLHNSIHDRLSYDQTPSQNNEPLAGS